MKWKEIIFGALVTLMITVLGGVAVYYFTKDPQAERLVYEVTKTATMKSDRAEVSFTTLRLVNSGELEAEGVSLGLEFPASVHVTDTQVTLSSGPAGDFKLESVGDGALLLKIPVLAPSEMATLVVLTDAVADEEPEVGVKSQRSVGSRGALERDDGREDEQDVRFIIFIVLALIGQLPLFYGARRVVKRLLPPAASRNNTGFVLLHQGMTDLADTVLTTALNSEGGDSNVVANLGLAKALLGQSEMSERLFAAAGFWAGEHKHSRAVVLFNHSLAKFENGASEDGTALMAESVRLSEKEVRRYLRFSIVVSTLRNKNIALHDLLTKLEHK